MRGSILKKKWGENEMVLKADDRFYDLNRGFVRVRLLHDSGTEGPYAGS